MTRELTLTSLSEQAENYKTVKERDLNEGQVENQFKLENWLKGLKGS